MAGGKSEQVQAAPAKSAFSDIASELEAALAVVRSAKEDADLAAKKANDAQANYQSAIRSAQSARKAYDAHVNEAMSGFAQLHQ